MRILHAFMRGVTRLNNWLGKWVAYLLLVIFLLLLAEVGSRYVVGSPAVWTGELSQMLFGIYAVLSGGYIMAHNGHVNVDLLHSQFSPRVKAIVDIFTSVLFFIFVGALLYFGSSLAYESMSFWERSQSAWNPPIWPVKLAIPVGAALLLLQGLVKLLQDILTALNIEPPQGQSWHFEPEHL
jgi:TRAP-type mannitol/chloroaromatic compound transport system permease small subunit